MKKYLSIILCVFSVIVHAQVELPAMFLNDMVLQRNKPIPVWGWANANESIEVRFNKQTLKTKADKDGSWKVILEPEAAGGPYKLVVKSKNIIEVSNVLVGEVWICSGQSNMEFTVREAFHFEEEVKKANNPKIRQFHVERDMASKPKSKLKEGRWSVCNEANVGDFTAVGYYFAKQIYAELKIPIGIISTSWGGTCVETWTSTKGLKSSNEFKQVLAGMPEVDIQEVARTKKEKGLQAIEKIQGFPMSSENESKFKEIQFNDEKWPEMMAPMLWEQQQLKDLDGTVWMRKTIELSEKEAGKTAVIELAKIDDKDITYINGVQVGSIDQYQTERKYKVPSGVLKEGKNVIAIKIVDYMGGGGIWGDPSNMKLTVEDQIVPLAGKWKFQVVDFISNLSPNDFPSLLYNAMINPLIPFAFQGVLWYQGEANVNRAEQYKTAFPLMIKDWRKQWGQGDFPFYFVQLSSFDEFGGNSQNGSAWAELREAQTETLTLNNTGMAVTIDIGNAIDIHPRNKQDVGKRLAAIALNNDYGKRQVFSGPLFKSMEVKDHAAIISFNYLGGGLTTSVKDGNVLGFEIAGKDKKFHKAKATINKDKVIVYSDKVTSPMAVRYGWADDAGKCNLYNKEGFPAVPFRTDDWNGITGNKFYLLN